MKQKERDKNPAQQPQAEEMKVPASVYDDSTFDVFDRGHSSGPIPLQTSVDSIVEVKPEAVKDIRDEMKLPDKQFRRNITLSEEQFRKLELIKKMKNKERGKSDELVTLDKLMFDMIQMYLDSNPYPEVNAAFDRYVELKKLGYGDLM